MVEIAMKENDFDLMVDSSIFKPDLKLDRCPFGCRDKCQRSWTNNIISHRIICECFCHKKNVATERLSNPSSVAVETSTLENKVNVQW